MKVLLINPSGTEFDGYTNPPLGLLYLAGTLQAEKVDVRVWDGCVEEKYDPGRKVVFNEPKPAKGFKEAVKRNLSFADLREALGKNRGGRGVHPLVSLLRQYRPDIVGAPCLTPKRHRALETMALVKEAHPHAMTVLGGAHASIMWKQILENYQQVDGVIVGEGERTLVELCKYGVAQGIDGLAVRDNDGKAVKPRPRKLIEDLDTIPFPAWGMIDVKKYPGRGEGVVNGVDLAKTPRMPVIFSRGCVGRCEFCSSWWLWGSRFRHRTARNMVDEMQLLYKQYGVTHFFFADDSLTVDRKATMELCDEIRKRGMGERIAWHATTRTDAVDEILLLRMKEAGCYEIAFGVETGSQPLLDSVGKGNTTEINTRAIRLTKQAGIRATALIMVGNPGETDNTVRETKKFLETTRPNSVGSVGSVWVLPGTAIYRDLVNAGKLDEAFWLGKEPYPTYLEGFTRKDLKRWNKWVHEYEPVTTTDKIKNYIVGAK